MFCERSQVKIDGGWKTWWLKGESRWKDSRRMELSSMVDVEDTDPKMMWSKLKSKEYEWWEIWVENDFRFEARCRKFSSMVMNVGASVSFEAFLLCVMWKGEEDIWLWTLMREWKKIQVVLLRKGEEWVMTCPRFCERGVLRERKSMLKEWGSFLDESCRFSSLVKVSGDNMKMAYGW